MNPIIFDVADVVVQFSETDNPLTSKKLDRAVKKLNGWLKFCNVKCHKLENKPQKGGLMMKALKGLSLFGGLAIVLTLFLVIGCSNNTPVQPDNPGTPELGRPGVPEATCDIEIDYGLIDKSTGGTIEIERGEYLHKFVVEPRSISESTLITIISDRETILDKEMISFEFGPDGLEFSESAKLQFEVAELGGDLNSASLYYYHPIRKKWYYISSSTVSDGKAVFNIDHFSKYAISD